MSTPGRWRTNAVAAARLARDGWAMLGLALLLLLVLEAGYRAQRAVRRSLGGPPDSAAAPRDSLAPYADSAWYPEFLRERGRISDRWEPFVYTRLAPQRGAQLNIDSAGLRVVPRYRVPEGKPLRVFFFGGSTTWGWFERDSATRPAVVARKLAAAGYDAEVVNFAQIGYVSDQEVLTLVRELERGDVPDAVVFWDGVNDLYATQLNGTPGESYREYQRDSDYEFNVRRRKLGRVDAALAIRSLALRSALLARLLAVTARRAPRWPAPDSVPLCRGVMRNWLGEARFVDRLAQAYGFTALMIWQPQWATSARPRSAFERREAVRWHGTAPGETGLAPAVRECARVADSLVAAGAARSIYSLAALHRADTGTVFLDEISHTTERATAIEGDTVAQLLLGRLRR